MRVSLSAAARRAGWLAACVLCIAACTPRPKPAAFGSGLAEVPASTSIRKQERAMFERLNRDRKAQGLSALSFDARLSEIARHHSADMRDHGFFEHESPTSGRLEDRLDAAGYLFLTARENLSEAPDVERSQDGLLASPHHYENIMAPDVTHVGIGIVEGGVKDPRNLTLTQVFATPLVPEAPAQARSRILERISSERAAKGTSRLKLDPELTSLAEKHIVDLDAAGSPESAKTASEGVGKALEGKVAGRLWVSAQVVPGSQQLAVPEALASAPSARLGLAVRRVEAVSGRPALQVLLIVLEVKR